MKIALLLPRSTLYGTMGKDVVNALNLVFRKNNESFELVIEDISHGANEDLILEKAQKIILQVQPDVTIAIVNYQLSQALVKAFVENRELLMIMNLGGNYPLELEIGPSVFYHSLNVWESAYAAGQYLAKKGMKKAIVSASFYDCGYHMNYFFAEGFEANGGKVALFNINQKEGKGLDFSALDQAIATEKPDSLFAIYNNEEARQFLDHWNAKYVQSEIELLTLGVTLEESFLKAYTDKVQGLESVLAWATGLPGAANEAFVSDYDDRYELPPSVFSVLAYEIGLVLVSLLKDEAFSGKRSVLFEKVKSVNLDGVFRKIAYQENHHIPTHHFLRRVTEDGNRVSEERLSISEGMRDIIKELEGQPISGWKHPYLCL